MIATRRFALAALAVGLGQTAILGYMVESRASILRYGTEILLQTALVDPRDLLRGDYVILSYDISTIPAALVTGERPVGDEKMPLQVRLRPGPDGFWTVTEASFQPLPAIDASVVIPCPCVPLMCRVEPMARSGSPTASRATMCRKARGARSRMDATPVGSPSPCVSPKAASHRFAR